MYMPAFGAVLKLPPRALGDSFAERSQNCIIPNSDTFPPFVICVNLVPKEKSTLLILLGMLVSIGFGLGGVHSKHPTRIKSG